MALACCPDRKAQGRINAILLLLCGGSFELTQAHAGVAERCLQLWIKCFNDAGIDGITYHPKSGRPRSLSSDEVAREILPVVDDPSRAERHHWTVVGLFGWLTQQRELDLSYRTLVRYLHEHDYARRIPRPVPEPPDQDAWQEQRRAFVPQLLELLNDSQADVYFGDEAGFEGDPRPRQCWVKRGSRPTAGYHGGHLCQGAPGTGRPAGVSGAGQRQLASHRATAMASHPESVPAALQSGPEPDRAVLAVSQEPRHGRIFHR